MKVETRFSKEIMLNQSDRANRFNLKRLRSRIKHQQARDR